MNIAIPMEGRICAVIHTTFVVSKRLTKDRYSLTGDSFNMTDVAAEQVLAAVSDFEKGNLRLSTVLAALNG